MKLQIVLEYFLKGSILFLVSYANVTVKIQLLQSLKIGLDTFTWLNNWLLLISLPKLLFNLNYSLINCFVFTQLPVIIFCTNEWFKFLNCFLNLFSSCTHFRQGKWNSNIYIWDQIIVNLQFQYLYPNMHFLF